jgi:hypothetical protein
MNFYTKKYLFIQKSGSCLRSGKPILEYLNFQVKKSPRDASIQSGTAKNIPIAVQFRVFLSSRFK